MNPGTLAVVDAWLEAVNQADCARLEQLTHQQVEIAGPRSSDLMVRQLLSEWLIRAGFSAESLRWSAEPMGMSSWSRTPSGSTV